MRAVHSYCVRREVSQHNLSMCNCHLLVLIVDQSNMIWSARSLDGIFSILDVKHFIFLCLNAMCLLINTVVSPKRAHGRSTLQVCQRGGWVLFRLSPHLTMKERPRHVYSDLKHSKQIIGHKITYNVITSGFEVES